MTLHGRLFCLLTLAAAPLEAGALRYVASDATAPLVDPLLRSPEPLALLASGRSAPVRLPFAVDAPGGPYEWLVADRRGRFELHAGEPVPPAPGLFAGDDGERAAAPAAFDVLAADAASAAVRVLLARAGEALVLRWVDPSGDGRGAVFEALLKPGGAVRYQYYRLPADAARRRVGYRGPGGELRLRPGAARAGRALELRPRPMEEAAPADGERPGAAADCTRCPVTDESWLVELAASGRTCAPNWDANRDGIPDGDGCSCDPVAGTVCSRTDCVAGIGRILRSTPTTTVDTKWEFDEEEFCVDCPYRFYVLVECGTEMHIPLSDMDGARLQITEVLTGRPVAITCENEAFRTGKFVDTCGPPVAPATTRYFWPPFQTSNASDPARPVEWGFADGCKDLVRELDQDGDDRLSCDVPPTRPGELPTNPGGTLNFADLVPGLSPGDRQLMDCRIASPQGLCGLFRLEIASGGNHWELYSNCTGDSTENFRIFDRCADACAAFAPLPELALSNLQTVSCAGAIDLRFDVTNLGCTDAGAFEYRIETTCPSPDVKTVPVTGLAANSSRTFSDGITPGCPEPFDVIVSVDPANAVAECSESTTAAKCAEIAGSDSLTAPACACTATVTPDAQASAPRWCEGAAPPQLTGAGSVATGCASGQLEYQWWKDAVASGSPLTAWSTDPAFTPGAEAADGANTYAVDVRCAGETCSDSASVTVTRDPAPPTDAGPDVTVCRGQSVPLGTPGTAGLEYSWSPGSDLDDPALAQPTFRTNGGTPLGPQTLTLTVRDPATGCVATDPVVVDVVSGAPVGAIGNNLKALRLGADVRLDWRGGPLVPKNYNVHRESDKRALDPNPAGPPIGATGSDEVYVDQAATPPTGVYFYQVYGRDCSGASIFN